MNKDDLIRELSQKLDLQLAQDLVTYYIEVRNEYKTETLGNSSIGKFIETVVQVLQYLDSKKYEKNQMSITI